MTRDRVRALVDRAAVVLDGQDVDAFADPLASLPPGELLRFDTLSRSWYSGLSAGAIAAAPREAWEILGLVSADGRERERRIRGTPLTSLTARLLAIRATDWAQPVRHAVLIRLDACGMPHATRQKISGWSAH